MGFNKGEWSELYSFLYLLEKPELVIVNENLEVIENNLFKILEIIFNESSYKIDSTKIIKISSNGEERSCDKKYISKNSKLLLDKIINHAKATGSFEIEEMKPLINNLLDGKKPKGSSNVKGDLEANVSDNNLGRIVRIKYNIKSNLGKSATILNASNNTNFIYELDGANDEIMDTCNLMSGKTKLIDRCKFLNENAIKINFKEVDSPTFDYNLKMIDSNLDQILANMLYLSYEENEKDILKLIEKITKDNDEYAFYKKKITDFANSVTFGMRAGDKWDGANEVNGGILLVDKTGEVYLLDLIYYKELVNKYLIENIKLESPSTTRYKMFEIYKDNNKYYFKLNLQIRFK